MTLGDKLFIIFIAFLALIGLVMVMAFRERKLARQIGDDDLEAQRRQDGRVLAVVFTAVIGGLLLTLLVAWIVFL